MRTKGAKRPPAGPRAEAKRRAILKTAREFVLPRSVTPSSAPSPAKSHRADSTSPTPTTDSPTV
ncbi:hypothetical protein [Streptomyces sp. NBC_01483]|uniref:hypothetical protein n=1 Tax=Streptomyces sp. NBC_01483 TaxID=2903883 RepID=UPI002E30F3BA|nr:hypothetical protein [Streptomyces sp. NBC_01483]